MYEHLWDLVTHFDIRCYINTIQCLMELLCSAETSENKLGYITACSQKTSKVSSDRPCFLIISAQFTGYILPLTV